MRTLRPRVAGAARGSALSCSDTLSSAPFQGGRPLGGLASRTGLALLFALDRAPSGPRVDGNFLRPLPALARPARRSACLGATVSLPSVVHNPPGLLCGQLPGARPSGRGRGAHGCCPCRANLPLLPGSRTGASVPGCCGCGAASLRQSCPAVLLFGVCVRWVPVCAPVTTMDLRTRHHKASAAPLGPWQPLGCSLDSRDVPTRGGPPCRLPPLSVLV